MADFSPAISKSLTENFNEATHLHCRFHFWNILNSKFKSKVLFPHSILEPSKILARFKDYFSLKVSSKRVKKYDLRRIIKYDIAILSKLPSKTLFDQFFQIITPFWKKYCPSFFTLFKKEYIEDRTKAGWANYISSLHPKTNNNLEGYNKNIKSHVTEREIKEFGDYFNLLVEELQTKSAESANIVRLAQCPSFNKDFYSLGKILGENFERIFCKANGNIYIKDPSVNCTFHARKKSELCTFLKKKLSKITSEEEEKNYFLSKFSKPSERDVQSYEECKTSIKYSFIQMAKIRKIEIDDPINNEYPLKSIRCTCPDFFNSLFCLHILGVLFHRKHISDASFVSNKKRGRKPELPSAWENDLYDEEHEDFGEE